MFEVNWMEVLGWKNEQLDDIRFAGFSYLREGQYDRAIIYFEALTVLDENNTYDNQTLGALYLQTGKYDLALTTLDHALALDPTHDPTQLNKVKTLLMLNQKAEALQLAKVLERSKDVSVAGDASALIEAYS